MTLIERFHLLHGKLRELEQFVNKRDELHLGKPDAVGLRYPLQFDSCNVYVTDEQFVKGVVNLAKLRMGELKRELDKLADQIN